MYDGYGEKPKEVIVIDNTKKKKWWNQNRAHENNYPLVPRSIYTDNYARFPRQMHPKQRKRLKFEFSNEDLKFKDHKHNTGRFSMYWRRYAIQNGVGTLTLPFVADILGYTGKDNVAGFFQGGYIGCRIEGSFYAVPIVWGWPEYNGWDKKDEFYERDGGVKPEYIEHCTKWGIHEGNKPGLWEVSPSLWKTDGPDKLHFMLSIKDVPDPAPWTIGQEKKEKPIRDFTDHKKGGLINQIWALYGGGWD